MQWFPFNIGEIVCGSFLLKTEKRQWFCQVEWNRLSLWFTCVTVSAFTAQVARAFTSKRLQATALSHAGTCDLDLSVLSAAGKEARK